MQTPAVVEPEPKPNRTPLILLAAGCGVLLLVSLCCLTPALYWYFARSGADSELAEEATEWNPLSPPSEPRHVMPLSPVSSSDPNVPTLRTVRVQITHVQGLSTPAVGSECSFIVERRARRSGTFWCHTIVSCGGPALFGNERLGFFECTIYEGAQRHVVGEDAETTSVSRDPAFRIDTINQDFEVRDDASGMNGAFVLRGRVLGVE